MSLVVRDLEQGQKLLQLSWRGELSCCCYAVIRQSTSRQQAVNKQSKGNQYNDYPTNKERRLTGHVITNFQLFLAVVLLLSKAALAGHKIGQNE